MKLVRPPLSPFMKLFHNFFLFYKWLLPLIDSDIQMSLYVHKI